VFPSVRIVFISEWFSDRMGYAENCLPKAVAALGHEVHLITSNVQPYFDSPTYSETYEPFLGSAVSVCGDQQLDGYTLHRLPFAKFKGQLRMRGLVNKLRAVRPHVVQVFDEISLTTYEAALAKSFLGYRLFLESHRHKSVFYTSLCSGHPMWSRFSWSYYAPSIGRLVSFLSEKCYAISVDAADISTLFFGVEKKKVSVCSLGVDTDLFRPPSNAMAQQARSQLRRELGFSSSDIVCIYTGRFNKDKNPLCLAQAIEILAGQGKPFRGLFVGNGPQAEAIRAHRASVICPFMPFRELPRFYWAADIGVWPKQESTSQLDAAACGLPIILGDRVHVLERVDGNGLLYEEDNPHQLAHQLETLSNPRLRQRLGECGARKMQEHFSWSHIARQRIHDYEEALRR